MKKFVNINAIRIAIGVLVVLMAFAGVENARGDLHAPNPYVSNTGRSDDGDLSVTANLKQVQQTTTDATLSGLSLTDSDSSDVALDPAFQSSTRSYTATVDEVVDVIAVTPTKNDEDATFEFVEGSDTSLTDTVTTETYTVTVTRPSDSILVTNANLSNDTSPSELALADTVGNAIALTPAFETGTRSCTASVGTDTDKVTVTSAATEDGAMVAYQDGSGGALVAADSDEGFQVALSPGTTTTGVHVTALDGKTTGIHTIAVSRAVWEATLTGELQAVD